MEFHIMEHFMRGMKLRLVSLICTVAREFVEKRNRAEQNKRDQSSSTPTSPNAEEANQSRQC